MDDFLNSIYINVYKKWILGHNQEDCKIRLINKDEIEIKIKYGIGKIVFHDLNIVEFQVTNTVTNEIEFYLHFQFNNMRHAVELFNEMLSSTKNLSRHHEVKVLLSCSGGLTTSYFAQKINEATKLLGIDMRVDAVGYNNLYKVGQNYDIILLAPQISYMASKVEEILKDKVVLKIPSTVFAKYDVQAILKIIEDNKEEKKKENYNHHKVVKLNDIRSFGYKTLCMAFVRNSQRVHISYRVYGENNEILIDNEIIKKVIKMEDFYDLIDTLLAQYTNIQKISMALPGIIHEDKITQMMIIGMEDIKFADFEKRYSQKFVYINDVNAVTLGYHAAHKELHNFSLIFQPIISFAGVGNIINDKLILGKHYASGEVAFLPHNKDIDGPKIREIHKTPEGALQSMAKSITSIICVLDPEEVVFCCFLIPDVKELRKVISEYIPDEYIPPITKIDYLQEYMLAGTLLYSYE